MEETPKSPWESKTIQAAIVGLITNALALWAIFTGKVYDLEHIRSMLDLWIPVMVSAISVVSSALAIKGRMNATQPIAKKEKP